MTLAPDREQHGTTALTDRLQDPQVVASLGVLLDHADLLALVVEGLDGFLERSDTISDSVIEGVGDLRSIVADAKGLTDGVDLHALKDTANTLMSSDLLRPEALAALELLSRGVVRGNAQFTAQPVQVSGLLSLNKLLKDPDINRAVSFLATLGKAIGQELNAPSRTSGS